MTPVKRVNGWALYQTRLFRTQLAELMDTVRRLKAEQPDTCHTHPKTKLLSAIYDAIYERVPADPGARDFDATRELGKTYRAWRRVKKGTPERYRLFFKFSTERRIVIYAWFNDEDTLRKQGSKTDVYEVFKRHLARGTVPDSMRDLIDEAAKTQDVPVAGPDG